MLWKKPLVLAAGVICSVETVRSADCNANGVEDALDLAPGNLELEPEHVWAQVSDPEAIVSGDWNSDGKVDLATANRASFNIAESVRRCP